MLSRPAAIAGSALWFLIAPGTLAGLLPWLIADGRREFDGGPVTIVAGPLLIAAGLAGLVESFARFAIDGRATPAPVTPARKLIVGGLYRHVRNPMYVSVLAVIAGEALLFGEAELLVHAGIVWLVFHLFVRLHEEPAMRRSFPRDYAAYSAAVPRWLPRIRPWQAGES
ncbi:isoprenylcysteine carboxylmethyltransferase family protein [Sphingomonas sp.]|uniref:methyltransferase family protein n=1 Tax=Sphingomonas sp. TaxID=28214 RepID=UPI0025D6B913|nr:isoprenylcysteine carboxylmethyltransferase family protein [Sphingomonas sp.]